MSRKIVEKSSVTLTEEEEKQMKNFSTWLLVMFMAMFWAFRIVVAVTYELGAEFGGIEPFNQAMEIILLFVVLACMLLIINNIMYICVCFQADKDFNYPGATAKKL